MERGIEIYETLTVISGKIHLSSVSCQYSCTISPSEGPNVRRKG